MRVEIPNEIVIKKASINEADIVAGLVIELLEEFNNVNAGNFKVNRIEIIEVTKQLIERINYAAFIAWKDDEAIGIITISPAVAIYNGGDFMVITEFFVENEERSFGIGEKLLNAAIDFAKETGVKKIEVGAPMKDQWKRTFGFYIKNGFKEKGPKLRLELY